jgi:hypothetical protein
VNFLPKSARKGPESGLKIRKLTREAASLRGGPEGADLESQTYL